MTGRKSLCGLVRQCLGLVGSYALFISWALITLIPLLWMGYSSFKSNEELTLDIYALPKALFDNKNDEYLVIPRSLNVILPYDPELDTRERLIIESTTIAPTRRLLLHFLIKEEMPVDIARLQPGDTLRVSQLPRATQWEIHWKTV